MIHAMHVLAWHGEQTSCPTEGDEHMSGVTCVLIFSRHDKRMFLLIRIKG